MKKNQNQKPISLNPSFTRGTCKQRGFTLVELLVVISIISILTIISLSSFNSSQKKARDAQRKSDLNNISKALMMYFNDNGIFPGDVEFGNVDVGLTGTDGTVYIRQIPQDPKESSGGKSYYYDVNLLTKKSFKLFADLENRADGQCLKGPGGEDGKWTKDSKDYCYGVASPNITIDEELL